MRWRPSLPLWSRIHCEHMVIYMRLLTWSHRLSMCPSKPLVDAMRPPQQTSSTPAPSTAPVTLLPGSNDHMNASRESSQIDQVGTRSGSSNHTGKLWILTGSILTSALNQTWIQACRNHQRRCYLDQPYNHPHRRCLWRLSRRRRHGVPRQTKARGKCHKRHGFISTGLFY